MPLRHYQKAFFVDPSSFEESEFVRIAKKKMGEKLYNMAVRVFSDFIATREEEKSKGYFVFASIVGHNGSASKHDVDYLWQRMIEIYGKDEAADDTIHRVLGTICMICVAKDKRKWVYVEDADKNLKLSKDKIPDPNQYFIGDYKIPKPKR